MTDAFVLICTPCYSGSVCEAYLRSIINLLADDKKGFQIEILTSSFGPLITRARNSMVTRFLLHPKATHLMFIDADMGFGVEGLKRLVEFDEDVVAGIYPCKFRDWSSLTASIKTSGPDVLADTLGLNYVGIVDSSDTFEFRDGFCTASFAGTGFMLIKRGALEKMILGYPETRFKGEAVEPGRADSDIHFSLFDCAIEPETDLYISEDYNFCKRWRKLGGKIWIDTQSQLIHVGTELYQGRPMKLRSPS